MSRDVIPSRLLFTVASAASCLLLVGKVAVASAGGAFQSGPNVGAIYAGGLDYDDTSDEVLITGITYDHNSDSPTNQCSCFVANLDRRYLQDEGTISARIGQGEIVEVCHSISVLDSLEFIVVGHSDPGGIYGSADVPTGFVLAMNQNDFAIATGTSLDSTQTSYPVRVIADDWNDAVYVAGVTSNNLDVAPNYQNIVNTYPQPNWLQYRRHGSSFEMTIHKLNYVDGVLSSAWMRQFPVDVDPDGRKPDVYVAGMIYKDLDVGLLIIAGSTRGLGDGYGLADGDDEDGFITVIYPSTGEFVANGQKTNERIGTGSDDFIGGICDDPNDDDAFYIVGATKGQLEGTTPSSAEEGIPPESLKAFVMKVQLETLEAIWSVQWGAVKDTGSELTFAMGLECLVVDSAVYVAGTVENGASIAEGLSHGASRGRDDIWVAQLNGDAGSINWIHQLGTEGDDHLARGGGLGLDHENNLIVYGDTNGSFYRARDPSETTSDIFLVTMSQSDGSYPDIGGAQSPVAAPSGPAPTADATSQPAPTAGNGDSTAAALSEEFGIQSGPSVGPLFAGGMVYDANQDAVYLTGLSYDPGFESDGPISDASSCFVAYVSLDEGMVWDWEVEAVFGDPLVLEVCNSLALHRFNELVVVGSVDQASNLIPASSASGVMSGMALAVSRDDLSRIDSTSLTTLQPTERFEYPVAVVSNEEDLFIVALTSTDNVLSNEYSGLAPEGESSPFPINWVEIQKYGSSFDMTVTKLSLSETDIDGVNEGGIAFETQWSKEFPISFDNQTGTFPRVYIGGAIVKRNYLAIAGSTRGLGDGYGDAIGNDEDGFITLLDLDTGDFAVNDRSTIREGSADDDIVTGICDDPNDETAFFITGATYGTIGTQMSNRILPRGSLQAFLRKVDADSLEEIWTIQWGAVHANPDDPGVVYARACAVFGSLVYVGGVVESDAGIVQGDDARQTSGGDDIWVAQIATEDGSVNWLHQVGSSGADRMAPRGGLIASTAGHAIVFGDSTGPVYRSRVASELYDLIVMTFASADGSYGDAFMPVVATPAPTDSEPTPAPIPVAPTSIEPQPVAFVPDDDTSSVNDSDSSSSGLSARAIAGLLIGLLIILFILTWLCCRRRRGSKMKSVDDTDFEDAAKRDGVFASNGIGGSNSGSGYSDHAWASPSERGGLGEFLYSDEPSLGGTNLQGAGYSDLKNKGKEVI
jgi:hypothetical protein